MRCATTVNSGSKSLWLGYGSPGDVNRRDVIGGRRELARCTNEFVPARTVLAVDRAAFQAGLASVSGIDQHHRHASKSGFVSDELAKLVETPSVQSRPLLAAGLNPSAYPGEVFESDAEGQALRSGDDCLADCVVGDLPETRLSAFQGFELAFGGTGLLALKVPASVRVFAADEIDVSTCVGLAVTIEGKIDDTKIDTKHAFNADLFRVRHIAYASQIPLALDEHQIDFALAESEQGALALATDEGDFLAPGQRPDTHSIIGQETHDPVIIGLCGEAAESALPVFASLVSVSHFGDAAHGGLRGQPVHLADFGVGQLMQIELPKLASLEAPRGQVITGLIAAFKRLPQQAFLFWRWLEFDVRNQFHCLHIGDILEKFKKERREFLPGLNAGVSFAKIR